MKTIILVAAVMATLGVGLALRGAFGTGPGTTDRSVDSESSTPHSEPAFAAIQPRSGSHPGPVARPNFVVLVMDDADFGLFHHTEWRTHFPNIAQVADAGVTFTNCHATTPKCCPSRASFFRGQYASRLGVCTNNAEAFLTNGFPGGFRPYQQRGYDRDDLGVWLRSAGYRTMFVGKYLHNDYDFSIPAGWDSFHTYLGNRYFGTSRFTNGDTPAGAHSRLGDAQYRTRAEGLDACELIGRHLHATASQPQPFFLYYAPLAPHDPAADTPRVEPRYAADLPSLTRPGSANLNEEDLADKSSHIQAFPSLDADRLRWIDAVHRERLLALKTVDDALGDIFRTLEANGAEHNTFVFITSDHGFLLGEHRLVGKDVPYHEATRIPLFVSGPGVAAGQVAAHLLAHFDVTATVLELAQANLPTFLDAKSFAPLLARPQDYSPSDWRHSILLEHWESCNMLGQQVETAYVGLRTFEASYIEWANGETEYYEESTDPAQLENRIAELPAAVREYFGETLRNHRATGAAPKATVVGRDETAMSLISPQTELIGFADDDSGIDRVRVVILDPATGMFWNGTDWQISYVQLNPEVARPGGLITKWTYPLNLQGNLSSHLSSILVSARAVDVDGKISPSGVAKKLTVDSEAPDTTIGRPVRNETFASPARIYGGSRDNLGVVRVQLTLRNLENNTYWNGTDWQASWTAIPLRVSAEGKWHYFPALPPGRYGLWVRSTDAAGNVDPTPSSSFFYVDD